MKIAVQKWRAELGANLHCFCTAVLAEIATMATPNYLRHTLVHGEEEPVHTQTRTHARTHRRRQTFRPRGNRVRAAAAAVVADTNTNVGSAFCCCVVVLVGIN